MPTTAAFGECQLNQCMFAGAIKISARSQQVFRRVATQRQLRREQDVGTCLARGDGRFANQARVAGDVADHTVDLGDAILSAFVPVEEKELPEVG